MKRWTARGQGRRRGGGATAEGQAPRRLSAGDACGRFTAISEACVDATVTAGTPLELFVLTQDTYRQVLQTGAWPTGSSST